MNLLIKQNAGLGDIIAVQKIVHLACQKYDKVYFPVIPQYSYVKDYLAHPDNLIFEDSQDYCETLDLQNGAREFLHLGLMQAKYALAGVDMEYWHDYVTIKRDLKREEKINKAFGDMFKIYGRDKYILVADTYATPPQTFKAKVQVLVPPDVLPAFYISKMDGDNPFDWLGLISNATELHLVDSVFVYLAELVPTVARRLCIYPRSQHHKTVITKGLWKKDWDYIE